MYIFLSFSLFFPPFHLNGNGGTRTGWSTREQKSDKKMKRKNNKRKRPEEEHETAEQ
jgi:hypothetical protein